MPRLNSSSLMYTCTVVDMWSTSAPCRKGTQLLAKNGQFGASQHVIYGASLPPKANEPKVIGRSCAISCHLMLPSISLVGTQMVWTVWWATLEVVAKQQSKPATCRRG